MTLELRGVGVRLGGRPVLRDVDLTAEAGVVTGLIGPNGAGKTTLLDAVTGFVAAQGQVLLGDRPVHGLAPHERVRAGVSRTFQGLELFEDLSVEDNVRAAAEGAGADRPDGLLERLGLAEVAQRLPRDLSTGARSSVAVARALASRPRVLLLDEPAAGLDADGRAALAGLLREVAADGVAVVLVDHDADLVLGTCSTVHVLQDGALLTSGPPEQVRRDPAVVAAYLGDAAAAPRTDLAAPGEQRLLVQDLHAAPGGVPALLGVDVDAAAGEVVAVLGRNGAGKTTLLRTAAGLQHPSQGRVEVLGAPPRDAARAARRGVCLVPQGRGLHGRLTVRQNLRLASVPPAGVVDRFPDLAGTLDRPVGLLSGGQQQQVALGRAVLRRPRLLLVDELSLGLSPVAVGALLPLLREQADDAGAAVVVVEQHAALALSVADRAVVLDRGRVAVRGRPADVAADDALRASYLGG